MYKKGVGIFNLYLIKTVTRKILKNLQATNQLKDFYYKLFKNVFFTFQVSHQN